MKLNISVKNLTHSGLFGLSDEVESVEVECRFLPGTAGTRYDPPESDDVDNVEILGLSDWQEDALIGDDEFFNRIITAARESRDDAYAESMFERGL